MKHCKNCLHDKVCDMWAVESGMPFVNANTCDHFKDKSLVLDLPCKVGDIVYTIFEGKIETLKVVHAKTEESAEGVSKYYDAENKFLKMPFAECHIGKSIFITRETVEQALKEREQG